MGFRICGNSFLSRYLFSIPSSVFQPCFDSLDHLFHERTVSARVSIRGRRWETDDYIDRVLVPRAGGKGEEGGNFDIRRFGTR